MSHNNTNNFYNFNINKDQIISSKAASENNEAIKRSGTRVFKKSCPNGRVTAYLGKRDFLDDFNRIDPIDGVILVDPDYLKDRKVYVHVLAAFRYGRDDLDVLGLVFRKDLFLKIEQVYPPENKHQQLTRLQERLIAKLGSNAYPFYFELPHSSPASVTLQPGANDVGKPCGVDYELKAYVADNPDDKPNKRNSVRLAIRKLIYAPTSPAPQPHSEVSRDFLMSSGPLRLEATLDKEKYYHGESIAVNVLVDNNSRKSCKKIKISVIQVSDIMLFSRAMYKCVVDEIETDEGFPIPGNHTGWCKVYMLCPLLVNNQDKRGLALDGKLKHEDTSLASSTIVSDVSQKENLGIIVQYKVKVRLYLQFGSGDLCVELPFTLTHPEPIFEEEEEKNLTDLSHIQVGHSTPVPNDSDEAEESGMATVADCSLSPAGDLLLLQMDDIQPPPPPPPPQQQQQQSSSSTSNPFLVHLQSPPGANNPFQANHNALQSNQNVYVSEEEDLIFEDFARLRLQEMNSSSSGGMCESAASVVVVGASSKTAVS